MVHGTAGVGKTCAALCLLDYADGTTDYFTAADLCETLIYAQQGKLSDDDGTIYPSTLWRKIRRSVLVVLDEIACRDRVSDHHYEAVKRLIDERHGRPLVVCSNLDLSRVEKVYDDRIASRLAAGTVVGVVGEDRRLSGR